MFKRTAQNAQEPMRRATGMQMLAAAACVGTIALAGITFLFLQAPASKTARPAPTENVSIPRHDAAAVPLPESLPASEQRSVAAVPSVTTEARTVRAQGPAVLISHDNQPAHAKANPPPEQRITPSASLADPATPSTASQANNTSVRANDTHREIVAVERSGVNIRSGPSPNSRLVGSAPKGARLEVTNRSGHWIEIESDDVKGWISGNFVGPAERR
jgi:Bacterial SH3 domain